VNAHTDLHQLSAILRRQSMLFELRANVCLPYLGENVVRENEYLSAIAPNYYRFYAGMEFVWIVQ
jgi:hypothetical protein